MADVAEYHQDEQVRQVGSAPYHLCTVIFMAWEASRQTSDQCCLVLAFLVVRYKLLLRDPLHLEGWTDQAELLARVAGEVSLNQAEATQSLPA